MTWHTVCAIGAVAEGELRQFEVAGQSILIVHLEDGFYATQARCTHLFGPLKRARITAEGGIECPLHRAVFDPRTGEVMRWANFPPGVQLANLLRPRKALRCYPLRHSDGRLQVEI